MDSTLEEYFERVRQAYGIELVGTIESGDMRNETNGDVGIIPDPDEEPGEWVERKTIRQQERMEEDR